MLIGTLIAQHPGQRQCLPLELFTQLQFMSMMAHDDPRCSNSWRITECPVSLPNCRGLKSKPLAKVLSLTKSKSYLSAGVIESFSQDEGEALKLCFKRGWW